ncbi:3-phosphoshikimate 1-carboxyvinyltransferase [Candidatus Bathycorpusculum sp.]|uniref:3-phosphoshikimate 1-carboxyvinyltransferase n=1 Tax=Candidatus Bathycorpusculum sp. TaxID=2994959 RepID=UPI002829BCBF|nr:3-phosphoshikimate 1-carboxyvinyltransferase [Candidatus Termitimicrobium sp.]
MKKTQKLQGEVFAPSSKSYTQRMVIAASLSAGHSEIRYPLLAQDTEATLRAVSAFGAKVQLDEKFCWVIEGTESLRAPREPIDCGESGATLRFMIPIAALARGDSILLFRGSLKRRPVEPLLLALETLGVKTRVGSYGGVDAVFVQGNDGGGIAGGETAIAGDISSQFISGLMFACPWAGSDTKIKLTSPLESRDYVEMTRAVLANHGVTVELAENSILVPGGQSYKATDERVPGDFSSAAFLLAASAITHAQIRVKNLDYFGAQGDRAILEVLKEMGVESKIDSGSVAIYSQGDSLEPIDIDARNIPDLVPVIAALACYAKGTSNIWGAKRLRLKESDRLQAVYVELSKMGAEICLTEDGLTITGTPLHGAVIDSHNDHRIAMATSVAALGAEGQTIIQNAECIRKSYPQFFIHLTQLGADIVGGKLDR